MGFLRNSDADFRLLALDMTIQHPGYFLTQFEQLVSQGEELADLLWLVPRVEAAAVLKREWALFQGQGTVLAPTVVAADRLSQAVSARQWLNLSALVVALLRSNRDLCRGLSGEQIWALADEYLRYAMHLVVLREGSEQLAQYQTLGPYSEREAQVIVELSNQLESELKALCYPPQAHFFQFKKVVWFDDGEVWPGHWLAAFLPDMPVVNIKLPVVMGPDPWEHLAKGQSHQTVQLTVAADEHTQAHQAAYFVAQWLSESPTEDIAIAVSDRLAARRLLPVMDELGIRVDDRTGWRLSISAVAGWFHETLHAVSESGQLPCLVHPFSRDLVDGFQDWRPAAMQSLSEWADSWLALLGQTGVFAALEADAAGALILQGLRDFLAIEFEQPVDATAFLDAWRFQVENTRFKPVDVQSPVRMLPLLSTRLRRFNRVLILGCAQSQFQERPPGLLPPSVAQNLGFPGASLSRVQQISTVYELASNARQIVFSHACEVGGRHEPLLPELEWLSIVLERDYPQAKGFQCEWPTQRVSIDNQPLADLNLDALSCAVAVPETLRVTALDDLQMCGLRFGLMHCLPFSDQRRSVHDVFYSLRGQFVHRVLELATRFVQQGDAGRHFEQWIQPIEQAISQSFLDLSESDQGVLYPFVEHFRTLVPRLAGKLAERVRDGWVAQSTEKAVSGFLPLPHGRTIKFTGRIDRVEQRGEALAVVDIKFKPADVLKRQAQEPLVYPQLPAYQMMLDEPDAKLYYLGVSSRADKGKAMDWVEVEPPDQSEPFDSWGQALWAELSATLDSFFGGEVWAPRPSEACNTCSAFGVCRPTMQEEVEPQEGVNEPK